MKPTLLIGYGNPDRQDDGVALHILAEIARHLGRSLSDRLEDSFYPTGENPDIWFDLQLLPEMAQTFDRYQRICFIDAHAGSIPEEVQFSSITPYYQPSTLTHHLTPPSLLSFSLALTGITPEAVLVSVRGYQFGFSRALSDETVQLVPTAVKLIESWISEIS